MNYVLRDKNTIPIPQDLDAELARMGRATVQGKIDALSADDRAENIGPISSAFASRLRGASDLPNESDARYNQILHSANNKSERRLNQFDREAIGNGLIRDLLNSGACDAPTGSLIRRC